MAVWAVQAARNLFLFHSGKLADAKALVCDRGSQFAGTASFDEVFRTEGMKVFATPVRTPVANSVAERWIGSLRRELLDRTIIYNQRQLHRLAVDNVDHCSRSLQPASTPTGRFSNDRRPQPRPLRTPMDPAGTT